MRVMRNSSPPIQKGKRDYRAHVDGDYFCQKPAKMHRICIETDYNDKEKRSNEGHSVTGLKIKMKKDPDTKLWYVVKKGETEGKRPDEMPQKNGISDSEKEKKNNAAFDLDEHHKMQSINNRATNESHAERAPGVEQTALDKKMFEHADDETVTNSNEILPRHHSSTNSSTLEAANEHSNPDRTSKAVQYLESDKPNRPRSLDTVMLNKRNGCTEGPCIIAEEIKCTTREKRIFQGTVSDDQAVDPIDNTCRPANKKRNEKGLSRQQCTSLGRE